MPERRAFMLNETNKDGCRQALTLVFIENQEFENIYTAETAFMRGTLFKDLDKPFKGSGAV